MGFRFRKSIKLIPGVRLNLGLKGASLSVGGRGLTYNVGAKGTRVTAGLPGTGLSYSHYAAYQSQATQIASQPPPIVQPNRRFSATPLIVAAFIIGVAYLAVQNNLFVPSSKPSAVRDEPVTYVASPRVEEIQRNAGVSIISPIPLPRPRPTSLVRPSERLSS